MAIDGKERSVSKASKWRQERKDIIKNIYHLFKAMDARQERSVRISKVSKYF
jgi:hypothetical protein